MTCWIEDELHLEGHQPGPTWMVGSRNGRPCNAFCEDGLHATVVFISDQIPQDQILHHIGQVFGTYHRWPIIKVAPAHEVAIEMYPHRIHHGAPGYAGIERPMAWLVYFKEARG